MMAESGQSITSLLFLCVLSISVQSNNFMYSSISHRLLGKMKGQSMYVCCHLDLPVQWALVLRLTAIVPHIVASKFSPTQSIICSISSVKFLQSILPQSTPPHTHTQTHHTQGDSTERHIQLLTQTHVHTHRYIPPCPPPHREREGEVGQFITEIR